MNNETSVFLKLKTTLDEIHGWCLPEALATWDSLLCFQKSQAVIGNYLEIGVWKGKTAAMILHHANPESEKIVLVDINIQKDELQNNLKKICLKQNNVVYYETPSWGFEHVNLPPSSFKWIHIDGKHTGEAVYNDLKVADKFLSSQGIVCIDDFFELQYPQITQAVFRYLDRNPYSFGLFLCGFKKAYLARIEYISHYLKFCYENLLTHLESRNAFVTLSKTSYLADLNCFSIVPRYSNLIYRGPDWNKNHLEINQSMPIMESELEKCK